MRTRGVGLEAPVGPIVNDRRYVGGYQKKESLAIEIIVIVERTGLRVSPVFFVIMGFVDDKCGQKFYFFIFMCYLCYEDYYV